MEEHITYSHIIMGEPIPVYTYIWAACLILIPIISTIIFIHGWIRIRKFEELRWHHRFLYFGILLITASTLFSVFCRLNYVLFFLATNEWGAAQLCTTLSEIAHLFWKMSIGIIILSYCIGLVILLPKNIKRNTEAN